MQQEPTAKTDGVWFPAVRFADGGPLLGGEISYPLPSFLTADQALGLAQSADRLIAWATAMKMRALARVEEAVAEEMPPRNGSQPVRFGGDEAHALAVAEVATACAVSEGSAARSLNEAAELTTSQWEVLEAVEEGQISNGHARIILEQARFLPAGHAEKFSRVALQRTRTRHGRFRTAVELRSCLRRLRERLHPESLTARKAAAHRERGVWFSPEPDGMCTLTAYLPAEVGLAIFNGLDHDALLVKARVAERSRDSGAIVGGGVRSGSSTLPEFRADALAYRLLGGTGTLDFGAFRPEVVVTIPIGLALGRGTGSEATLDSAELAGYGPIDAPTARQLAALAPNWQRLFTDCTTGKALGVGRTAYRPPKALLRYLHSRDGTCRFPGCTRPVSVCEPDHTVEWQDGGTTDAGNLAMLCRRHHALKSIGAWTYRQLPGSGNLEWKSPFGRVLISEPMEFHPGPDPGKLPEPPPF
jgi:hypothetical protein